MFLNSTMLKPMSLKYNNTIVGIIIGCSIFLYSSAPCQEGNSRLILDNMFAAIKNIKTLTFTLKKKERIDNDLKYGEQKVKFKTLPKRIYTEIVIPNKGVELIYEQGKNDNMGYLNPNGFPYVNLNLNPYSSTLRKGNHHTIHEVGFEYISAIISDIYKEAGPDFNRIFLIEGNVVFQGKNCYKLIIDYFPYKLVPYTVLPNENVTDIAYKLFVSDYMILQYNKTVKDYDNVRPGQVIMVPNAYAKKTILYIDKITFMPLVQIMYDDKGLIAQYEFHDLNVNTEIKDEEFSSSYKDYHFK